MQGAGENIVSGNQFTYLVVKHQNFTYPNLEGNG